MIYEKYDMTGLKISTKSSNLGVRCNHSNLVEDEGLRRRPSGMVVTEHKDEVEESYGNEFILGGP